MNLPARNRIDVACALVLSLLTAALALWADGQIRRSGSRPSFYQEEFAPAVMFACGRGFHNVDWANRDPVLAMFLLQSRENLGCGELATTPRVPRDSFQRISIYLELAVGVIWRVAGVSWGAVAWLSVVLAGFFAAALYGVMRLGMRPPAAAIFSAIVVTSPLHLTYLPQLRDYSKAPFLLALVLLMGIAVKWALPRRRLLWLAVAGGLAGGIGFGFRTDILLAVAPLLAVLLVFRAGPPSMRWRPRLIESVTASAVFLASFTLAAAPVFLGYARGGNIGHVILLGLSSPFTTALGVEAKHYELSARYDDGFQATVVRSYASRVDGDAHLFSMGSEDYDRASSRYLLSVIRTFPGDVAIRVASAVLQILQAPFSPRSTPAPGWVRSGPIGRVYDWRGATLDRAGWLAWAASAAVVAGMAAWRVQCAVFLVFLIVFLGGGAAIQFEPRHYFYLEFMSWWAVGVMLDRAVVAGWAIPQIISDSRWRTRAWLTRVGMGVVRSATIVVVCVLGTAVVLGATRHDQQQGLNRLFEQALSLAGPPLRVTQVPNGADRVIVTLDLPELELSQDSGRTRSIGTAYLLIDVDPGRCDALSLFALARYQTISDGVDFTTPLRIPLVDPRLGSSVKILVPVYSALFLGVPPTRFVGIELRPTHASCIASIRNVGNLGALPVLVSAVLGPDWRTAPHYQTMTAVETREDGIPFHVRVYPTLPTLDFERSLILGPTANDWPVARILSRAAAFLRGSGMIVDGRPDGQYAYLSVVPERAVPRGTCFVADGELSAGGLTFGLLRNFQWAQRVNIVERGRFIAAGCTLDDGNYSIVLANDNAADGVTRARLARIGWVGLGGERQALVPALAVATKP